MRSAHRRTMSRASRGRGEERQGKVASAHVTAGSDGDADGEGRDPGDGAQEEDATQCDGDFP